MSAEKTGVPREGPPIACKLTREEQLSRQEELSRDQRVFGGYESVGELEDGYELVFAGGAEWAQELVDFVVFERECCPFFTFELIFSQERGPISLRVRGPEGTKELIGAELTERGE